MLRSGFIDTVREHLESFFGLLTRESRPSAEVHRETLARYKTLWRKIHSSSTCLSCLRRRPQYGLHCGHVVCENCILVFGHRSADDPWLYSIKECFLCGEDMPEEVNVRVHPPTAGVGVLCIDGGGVRGVAPLGLMKRIQDCVGLPIPFQRLIRVAFGISSGTFRRDPCSY